MDEATKRYTIVTCFCFNLQFLVRMHKYYLGLVFVYEGAHASPSSVRYQVAYLGMLGGHALVVAVSFLSHTSPFGTKALQYSVSFEYFI